MENVRCYAKEFYSKEVILKESRHSIQCNQINNSIQKK